MIKKELNKRQISAIKTKEKIIAASKKILSSKKFEEASIDDIVKLAGVAKGSFYVYFKHKEDVLWEINKTDFYNLAEIVSNNKKLSILERVEKYSIDFLKRIENAGIELCRSWIKNNLDYNVIKEPPFNNKTKFEYDINAIKYILDVGIEDKLLKKETPTYDIALYINAELYGLMILWCMSNGKIIGSKVIKTDFIIFIENNLIKYIK